MPRFNIEMDGDMLHSFKKIAVKGKTTMSDITRNLIDSYMKEQEKQARPRHALQFMEIKNSTSLTTITAAEPEKEVSPEDKRALVIKNLVKATREALPTISDMDLDEFENEIKTPVINAIYKHRASRYRQEQHTRSLVPLQTDRD